MIVSILIDDSSLTRVGEDLTPSLTLRVSFFMLNFRNHQA
jgi:hypothetical protein